MISLNVDLLLLTNTFIAPLAELTHMAVTNVTEMLLG
jgi:hypothetical protein